MRQLILIIVDLIMIFFGNTLYNDSQQKKPFLSNSLKYFQNFSPCISCVSAVQENHHKNTPLSLLAVNFKRPYRARFIITPTRVSEQLSHKAISKLALPTVHLGKRKSKQMSLLGLENNFKVCSSSTDHLYQAPF